MIITDDDGMNAMFAADLGEYFGHNDVYQIATSDEDDAGLYIRARLLFDRSATYDEIEGRLEGGPGIESVKVDSARGAEIDDGAIRMFVVRASGELLILTDGEIPELEPGDELIGLPGP